METLNAAGAKETSKPRRRKLGFQRACLALGFRVHSNLMSQSFVESHGKIESSLPSGATEEKEKYQCRNTIENTTTPGPMS